MTIVASHMAWTRLCCHPPRSEDLVVNFLLTAFKNSKLRYNNVTDERLIVVGRTTYQ